MIDEEEQILHVWRVSLLRVLCYLASRYHSFI